MDGTWKNGTWESGEWKDGIWEKGLLFFCKILNPDTYQYEKIYSNKKMKYYYGE
jgi:hypothetical protein